MGKFWVYCYAAVAIFASQRAGNAAIIISQYYEGFESNRFLELYNSGSSSVNLGAEGYKLSLYSNAQREAWKTAITPVSSTLSLTRQIAAGDTILNFHPSADGSIYAFNGDDNRRQSGTSGDRSPLTRLNARSKLAIRGLLLVGDFSTTTLTGGRTLREPKFHDANELWLN